MITRTFKYIKSIHRLFSQTVVIKLWTYTKKGRKTKIRHEKLQSKSPLSNGKTYHTNGNNCHIHDLASKKY